MVLDFDNGDLSPEEFERIFWSEAGRGQKRSLSFAIRFHDARRSPTNFG